MLLVTMSSCQVIKKIDKTDSKMSIRTTAYTANEKDHLKYKKKTASGTTLTTNRSVATDWSIIPVGTVLRIDNNEYVVDDYGSFILNAKKLPVPTVDVYQPNRKKMNQWGVRHFDDVEIVQMGSFEKSLEILKDRLRYKHCRVMYEDILKRI